MKKLPHLCLAKLYIIIENMHVKEFKSMDNTTNT